MRGARGVGRISISPGSSRTRWTLCSRLTRNSERGSHSATTSSSVRIEADFHTVSRFGDAVRLETASECPTEMVEFLLQQFGLSADDLYQVSGPVNLRPVAGHVTRG